MRETFTKGSLRRRIGIAAAAVAAAGVVAVPGVAWASNGISTGSSGPAAIEQTLPERTGTGPECVQAMVAATEAIQVSEEEAQKMRDEERAGAAEGIAATASTPAIQVSEEEAAKMRAEESAAAAVSC
ncbi:hypothetical protein M2284_002680 [Rhodococcus sp. LBL1]|nr:hypothetical protein [Rhodococcus sp. LBL1]MDH6684064.1 hypothetical protein [Rhodococcus sp. LBL2]